MSRANDLQSTTSYSNMYFNFFTCALCVHVSEVVCVTVSMDPSDLS